MTISKLSIAALLTGLAFNVNANLLISEVLYDTPNNDSTEEYVELFNAGCDVIDLSQYQISDNGSSYNLQGSLASGEYFTVAANSAGFNNLFNLLPDLSGMPLALGNSGDFVRLNKGAQEIDVVAWEGGISGWSLNVQDVSLYRTTVLNTKSAADWNASNTPGTPSTGSLTTNCGGTGGVSDNQLGNGQAKTNLTASTGQTLKYLADLPANATQVTVTMSGGSGDADLYVRQGSEPTSSEYDCAPYMSGNNEQCPISNPVAGRYYINLQSYAAFSGVSLVLNYTVNTDTGGGTGTGEGDGSAGDNGSYAFNTYYAAAIGQSGAALKASLNQIIKGHTRFSYSQVWDGLGYADEDPANSNNVILLYTGRSEPKTNRAGMSNSQDAWNREHVWAKSHGFPDSSQYAYTDLHHLRPADVSVNSSRGNKDFDVGGSEISEAPGNHTDADSFEPMDEVKGDVARMIFYMDVRYEGNDNSGTPDLSIANGTTNTGAALLGDLCTLLSWHLQDPVSDWERRRNNRIFEWQKNRNPFIDNSGWASELYGASCQ
ncbi:endonuclease I [Shewanella vesiculosa]|uniref:endonuclease n=1 Tax=Shewanella TaxID=22 RepID=UPI000F4EF6B2|nr:MULTISPECIES: endonuclease [Shewanella]MBB1476811.1 endonuclease [Shewanella sp. SG41-3]RPA51099.1 endonuclease I [Shewanella vesiculosa]UJL42151.1 endonuclease [Shewanella vesiculosa]|tara:strand:- start:130 stop:1764 length:1635 start_codon:yes stop_codon:yes gene_type:complete